MNLHCALPINVCQRSFSQSANFWSSHVLNFTFNTINPTLAETYHAKRLLSDKVKPFVVEISTDISDK
jgi:hypothetical protein